MSEEVKGCDLLPQAWLHEMQAHLSLHDRWCWVIAGRLISLSQIGQTSNSEASPATSLQVLQYTTPLAFTHQFSSATQCKSFHSSSMMYRHFPLLLGPQGWCCCLSHFIAGSSSTLGMGEACISSSQARIQSLHTGTSYVPKMSAVLQAIGEIKQSRAALQGFG